MMRDAYLSAMARAANSVTVVTTDGPAGRAGVTVSAMCSVSLDGPAPSLLVCIHEASPARRAIAANGVFCANLLAEDQSHISDCFAGRTKAEGVQKFGCATWTEGVNSVPVLKGALASFACRVAHHHAVNSHHIFIGYVDRVESAETGRPLVYHDRKYGRPAELTAP